MIGISLNQPAALTWGKGPHLWAQVTSSGKISTIGHYNDVVSDSSCFCGAQVSGLSNDGSQELTVKLNRFSQKAKPSPHRGTELSSKQELSGTRTGLREQDSAAIGQVDRPAKEQSRFTISSISELQFSSLLSHTRNQQGGAKSPALSASRDDACW